MRTSRGILGRESKIRRQIYFFHMPYEPLTINSYPGLKGFQSAEHDWVEIRTGRDRTLKNFRQEARIKKSAKVVLR